MSSCPEDPSRASEILFAEPWIHHPLGFASRCRCSRGWAALGWAVPQAAKPDGLTVFAIKTFCKNGSGQSSPWPRAFGTGSPKMHWLKPSSRAKRSQEISGTGNVVAEGDIKGMQFTGKVPEDLGVTVRRMTLNLYFKVDNSIGIIGSFVLLSCTCKPCYDVLS